MPIYHALLKYGYSNFELETLEYCSQKDILIREKYYIDLLKPEYNISNNPSAFFLGYKHTEEARAKITAANASRVRSDESRLKTSLSNPNCQKIKVSDLKLKTETIHNSIHAAARVLNVRQTTISNFISRNQQIPYKGRYIFKRCIHQLATDKNLISDDLILSDHLKKHTKPKTDEELGYYLAGLIEGDGYIGESRIEIAFHMDDVSSAYYLKKIIGYGSVLYLKGKNSVRYVLRHRVGLEKVFSLINGKLLSHHKIEQLIKHRYGERYNKVVLPKANFDLLSNH